MPFLSIKLLITKSKIDFFFSNFYLDFLSQVEMTYKSLNHGDVFVLDDGKTIYCWNGKDSSKRERVKVSTTFVYVTNCLFKPRL